MSEGEQEGTRKGKGGRSGGEGRVITYKKKIRGKVSAPWITTPVNLAAISSPIPLTTSQKSFELPM